MTNRINLNTKLSKSPDQLYSYIDGEVVMLSIDNGEYYNLNEVGSYIWNLLDNPCTFQEIIFKLREIYEVGEGTCINDTKLYLEEFLDKRLIVIIDE
ncbi:MAG: PqqD family protein [Bacteroidales bacterium]|nr:PqqD family protein [Bacteroidales bacterium]